MRFRASKRSLLIFRPLAEHDRGSCAVGVDELEAAARRGHGSAPTLLGNARDAERLSPHQRLLASRAFSSGCSPDIGKSSRLVGAIMDAAKGASWIPRHGGFQRRSGQSRAISGVSNGITNHIISTSCKLPHMRSRLEFYRLQVRKKSMATNMRYCMSRRSAIPCHQRR